MPRNARASGLARCWGSNDKDKLPGRLQQRHLSKSRDASPVNFIGWFGDTYSLRAILSPFSTTFR
jgi:hypothetical protein